MTTDPFRALDDVDPPDQWPDIVARSGDRGTGIDLADAPVVAGSRRPRALAAAALVVVVVALVGALVVRSGSEEPDRASDPDALWGRKWQLVSADIGGGSITTDLVASDGGAIVLDARQRGTLMLDICNEAGGATSIVDGRLVVRDWTTESMACADPLEDLVRIDGTAVEATPDRLVLTKPGTRYEFRPVGTLPPQAAITGRRWMVTDLTSRAGNRGTLFASGAGPILDLRDDREVVVEGCGPRTKGGEVDGDRLVVEPGAWTELMVDCALIPRTEYAPVVQEIIDAGATIERDEHRLVVRSEAGSFTAETYVGSSVWDLFDDPSNPSTARWAVVAGSVADEPRELIGDPVLTIADNPEAPYRTIALSGCGSFGGEISDIDDDENTIQYSQPLGGIAVDCSTREGDQSWWITKVLEGTPTVDVVGQRARIDSDAGVLLLVRLD